MCRAVHKTRLRAALGLRAAVIYNAGHRCRFITRLFILRLLRLCLRSVFLPWSRAERPDSRAQRSAVPLPSSPSFSPSSLFRDAPIGTYLNDDGPFAVLSMTRDCARPSTPAHRFSPSARSSIGRFLIFAAAAFYLRARSWTQLASDACKLASAPCFCTAEGFPLSCNIV